MRVLSVSNFYDTHGGGLERVAGRLNREFAAAGYKAMWAASDQDHLPRGVEGLVALRCINPTERLTGLPMPIPGPRSVMALSNAVHNAEIVVIHDSLYVTSILAMLLAKMRRRPVVLIQHVAAIPFANPLARVLMRIANAVVTRTMMAVADRLIFISHVVKEELLGDMPKRTSSVVFNGVDTTVFHPRSKESRNAARQRWNLPHDAVVIVFAGRFVEKKGLSVIKELASLRDDLHFVMLGEGPISPEAWSLSNIHVLGQQPQDMMADIFSAGDVFLLPSVGEGYPLVIQEAMACGLPIVCGAASARADPAASRWLCGVEIDLAHPMASAARCSEAIAKVLGSHIERDAMAQYAALTYNWSKMAAAILEGMDKDPNNQR